MTAAQHRADALDRIDAAVGKKRKSFKEYTDKDLADIENHPAFKGKKIFKEESLEEAQMRADTVRLLVKSSDGSTGWRAYHRPIGGTTETAPSHNTTAYTAKHVLSADKVRVKSKDSEGKVIWKNYRKSIVVRKDSKPTKTFNPYDPKDTDTDAMIPDKKDT